MKWGQYLSCFDDTEYLSNFKLSSFFEVVGDSLLLCMFEKQQKMKPLKTDFFCCCCFWFKASCTMSLAVILQGWRPENSSVGAVIWCILPSFLSLVVLTRRCYMYRQGRDARKWLRDVSPATSTGVIKPARLICVSGCSLVGRQSTLCPSSEHRIDVTGVTWWGQVCFILLILLMQGAWQTPLSSLNALICRPKYCFPISWFPFSPPLFLSFSTVAFS